MGSLRTRLAVFGKTGNGKTSFVNSLIGRRVFDSRTSASYVTEKSQAQDFSLQNKSFIIVDTPGDLERGESFLLDQYKAAMHLVNPGPHAFILVMKASSITPEEQNFVDRVLDFFGRGICDYLMIIFTRIEDLESDATTLNQFIDSCRIPWFRQIINLCSQRCLGISNRWETNNDKMINFKIDFMKMLTNMVTRNIPRNEIYSTETFEIERRRFEDHRERTDQQNRRNIIILRLADKLIENKILDIRSE